MTKNYAYVSVLTTDDYLPGLLVLNASLHSVKSKYHLFVLLTSNISEQTKNTLRINNISFDILSEEIQNPTHVSKVHRWYHTYSKLAVFNQTQYSKIVYLDVDMLVLNNIDNLFQYPHMSATNAGGMLPRKSSWTHLNSGIFVVKPSQKVFEDMMTKIGKIEPLEPEGTSERPKYGSDQDFINAYYPSWKKTEKLHLDHAYNMLHYYLDEYNELFGYTLEDGLRPIKVIHFASFLKPWNISNMELDGLETNSAKKLELKAIRLWQETYKKIIL